MRRAVLRSLLARIGMQQLQALPRGAASAGHHAQRHHQALLQQQQQLMHAATCSPLPLARLPGVLHHLHAGPRAAACATQPAAASATASKRKRRSKKAAAAPLSSEEQPPQPPQAVLAQVAHTIAADTPQAEGDGAAAEERRDGIASDASDAEEDKKEEDVGGAGPAGVDGMGVRTHEWRAAVEEFRSKLRPYQASDPCGAQASCCTGLGWPGLGVADRRGRSRQRVRLRPQAEAVSETLKAWSSGRERLLVAMATGAGKTFTFCFLAFLLRRRTLILVHRKELVEQTEQTLLRQLPCMWGQVRGAPLHARRRGGRSTPERQVRRHPRPTVAQCVHGVAPHLRTGKVSSCPHEPSRLLWVAWRAQGPWARRTFCSTWPRSELSRVRCDAQVGVLHGRRKDLDK